MTRQVSVRRSLSATPSVRPTPVEPTRAAAVPSNRAAAVPSTRIAPHEPSPRARGACPGRHRRPGGELMLAVALAAALAIAGCAAPLAPTAALPDLPLGTGWTDPSAAAVDSPGAASSSANPVDTNRALADWWRTLGDPALPRLVALALERNADLRQALLRVDEARALQAVADSRDGLAADARASVAAQRQSENGLLPIGRIPGLQRDVVLHDTALQASWEPDLFGRVRAAREAAQAQLALTRAEVDGLKLALSAEVARHLLALRGAQLEAVAHRHVIDDLARALALTEQRIAAGDLAPNDRHGPQAALDAARAGLPGIEARARSAALALGTLTGGLPEQELALLQAAPAPLAWPALPVGRRADLLRRRPDVQAAEARLVASGADLGGALAEQFPRLTIGASGGFQALDLGDLLKPGSMALSLAPMISWRFLDGGRVQAQIRAAQARERSAGVGYEKAVLGALGEAERALSDYRGALATLAAQREATAAAARVATHAAQRATAGDLSRLDSLDAQRRRHEADEAEARAVGAAAQQMALTVKALGGGW